MSSLEQKLENKLVSQLSKIVEDEDDSDDIFTSDSGKGLDKKHN